jgi:hypothetical protein
LKMVTLKMVASIAGKHTVKSTNAT